MKELNLPSWATAVKPGHFQVKAEEFYPQLFAELGYSKEAFTRKELEIAYQCMKMDLRMAITGTEMDVQKGALNISISNAPAWKQSNASDDGESIGTRKKQAKLEWSRIRGIPVL